MIHNNIFRFSILTLRSVAVSYERHYYNPYVRRMHARAKQKTSHHI